jgi:hypothetical protein
MIRFRGLNVNDHRKISLFPNLNEKMIINQIQFRNPAHQPLRFTVLYALIGQIMMIDDDVHGTLEFRKHMIQHQLQPPELWTARDGGKIKQTGVSGGNAGTARALDQVC